MTRIEEYRVIDYRASLLDAVLLSLSKESEIGRYTFFAPFCAIAKDAVIADYAALGEEYFKDVEAGGCSIVEDRLLDMGYVESLYKEHIDSFLLFEQEYKVELDALCDVNSIGVSGRVCYAYEVFCGAVLEAMYLDAVIERLAYRELDKLSDDELIGLLSSSDFDLFVDGLSSASTSALFDALVLSLKGRSREVLLSVTRLTESSEVLDATYEAAMDIGLGISYVEALSQSKVGKGFADIYAASNGITLCGFDLSEDDRHDRMPRKMRQLD